MSRRIQGFRSGDSSSNRRTNSISRAVSEISGDVDKTANTTNIVGSSLGSITPDQLASLSDDVWDDPPPRNAAEAIARLAIKLRAVAGVGKL